MPPTGQLVCPAHPIQKPHLRAGMMSLSSAMSGLSSSESSSSMKIAGCVVTGAAHLGAVTTGRVVNIHAEPTARRANRRVMTLRILICTAHVRKTQCGVSEQAFAWDAHVCIRRSSWRAKERARVLPQGHQRGRVMAQQDAHSPDVTIKS